MFTLGTPWQSSESNPQRSGFSPWSRKPKAKNNENTYFYINFLKILFLFSYDLGLKFSKTRY